MAKQPILHRQRLREGAERARRLADSASTEAQRSFLVQLAGEYEREAAKAEPVPDVFGILPGELNS